MIWSAFTTASCGSSASDLPPETVSVANTQNVESIAVVNGVGKLPITGCVAFDYFAEVNIGGQALNLLMDSGSTTLAVPASACTNCAPATAYKLSNTGTRIGTRTSSRYLDGSGWSGVTYSDYVALGNTTSLSTPAVSVKFAGITSQTSFFEEVDACDPTTPVAFDGIMGLGPDAQLASGTTSFLTSLAASKKLASDVFALHLCDIGGTMSVGGYDPAETIGSPNFTPLIPTSSALNTSDAYTVIVSQMSLGGTDFGLASSSLGPAVVDNGTGALILPSKAFAAFVSLIEQNQAYIANFSPGFISAKNANCVAPFQNLTREQLDAALPRLAYTFPKTNGGMFRIDLPATSSYLIAGTVQNRAGQPTVYCPAVVNGDATALIGNPAMRNHVVIFDRANGQLGFAPQTGCTQSKVSYYDGT